MSDPMPYNRNCFGTWATPRMIDPLNDLSGLVRAAVTAAFGDAGAAVDLAIRRSEHTDYQADVAMALARKLKRNPRDIAAAIVAHIPTDALDAAVSGPGFINLTCSARYLGGELDRMYADDRLGIEHAPIPQTVVRRDHQYMNEDTPTGGTNMSTTATQTQMTVIAKIRTWLRQLRAGQNAMFRYDREFQA